MVDGGLSAIDELLSDNLSFFVSEDCDKKFASDMTGDKTICHINEIVGDFDTVSSNILGKYQNNPQIKIIRHNPEKDATDTELALIRAVEKIIESGDEKAESEIIITGGIGKRMDHTIGNINCLKIALDNEIKCKIIDSHNEISLINKDTRFIKKDTFGKYISFLPFTDIVEDVNLIGFKYPLESVNVAKGNTLCISNELREDICELRLKNGCFICIKSQD